MRKVLVTLFVIVILSSALLMGIYEERIRLLYRKHFGDEFFIDPTVEIDSRKTYTITFWAYRLPCHEDGNCEVHLRSVLDSFSAEYPNIKVEYQLWDVLEGESALEKALTEGNPPDLYLSIFEQYAYFSELQVPVEYYLDVEVQSNYAEVSLSNFQGQKHLWGWPVYIETHPFVVNTRLGMQADNLGAVLAQPDGSDKSNLLDHSPYGLWADLCLPSYIARLSDEDARGFTEIMQALRLGYQSSRIVRGEDQGILPFLENNSVVVGPVNPWLLSYLKKSSKHEVQISFPMPLRKANAVGLCMFRQKKYKGHDHLKAVAQLTRYLAEEAPLGIELELYCSPAHKPRAETWMTDVDLGETELVQYYENIASALRTRYVNREQMLKEQQFLEGIATKLWGQFINGDVDANEFYARLRQQAITFLEQD